MDRDAGKWRKSDTCQRENLPGPCGSPLRGEFRPQRHSGARGPGFSWPTLGQCQVKNHSGAPWCSGSPVLRAAGRRLLSRKEGPSRAERDAQPSPSSQPQRGPRESPGWCWPGQEYFQAQTTLPDRHLPSFFFTAAVPDIQGCQGQGPWARGDCQNMKDSSPREEPTHPEGCRRSAILPTEGQKGRHCAHSKGLHLLQEQGLAP